MWGVGEQEKKELMKRNDDIFKEETSLYNSEKYQNRRFMYSTQCSHCEFSIPVTCPSQGTCYVAHFNECVVLCMDLRIVRKHVQNCNGL